MPYLDEIEAVKKPGRPMNEDAPPRPEWAIRIREAREARGLSQDALAQRVGKSQSQIGGYENGQSEPNMAMFGSLGDALGVSAVWLAFGEPSQRDAVGVLVGGEEQNRLFSWALHRVAKLLTDEGLDADLPYLVALTRKVTKAANAGANDAEAREIISRAIDTERAEFRHGLDAIRKNRI